MHAVVIDGAEVGEEAFVAAMSFVKAGFKVPPRTLVAGSPARVIRELSQEEITWKGQGTAEYQELARRSLATLRRVCRGDPHRREHVVVGRRTAARGPGGPLGSAGGRGPVDPLR
jgi:hypothetical protein